jgi:hypothetical protein
MPIRLSKLVVLTLACAPACAQLPDAPGKDVTVKICGNCHDIDVIAGYHQGKQAWSDMIAQMIEKGAEGTEDEFKTVLDYLVKNFGPTSGEGQHQQGARKRARIAIGTYGEGGGGNRSVPERERLLQRDLRFEKGPGSGLPEDRGQEGSPGLLKGFLSSASNAAFSLRQSGCRPNFHCEKDSAVDLKRMNCKRRRIWNGKCIPPRNSRWISAMLGQGL